APRIPAQQALLSSALDGTVRETLASGTRPVPNTQIALRNLATGQTLSATTSAEGVFRILPISPGHYALRVQADSYTPLEIPDIAINANEVLTLEISLTALAASSVATTRLPRLAELGPALESNENTAPA